MSIKGQLSRQSGARTEQPNIRLAHKLAAEQDTEGVKELMDLALGSDKSVAYDCVKVIYELGALKPELIAPYFNVFLQLLDARENRLNWGGMTAISTMAHLAPDKCYKQHPKLMEKAEHGSVITNDHLVKTMVAIGGKPAYRADMAALLMEKLTTCPENQFPSYAEQTATLLTAEEAPSFLEALALRLPLVESATKLRRVEKLMGRVRKKFLLQ